MVLNLVIDCHLHVWTLDANQYPWQPTLPHVPIPTVAAPAEDLDREMRLSDVEFAVLVQPSTYGWDNRYLCDALRRQPERFVGVCLVDPRSPTAPDELRLWASQGCQGLRVNVIAESVPPEWAPSADRLWVAATDLAMSVSFQARPDQVGPVAEVARRHPELTVLVDYLGSDAYHNADTADLLRPLADLPNVYFKLLAVGQDAVSEFPFSDLWPVYERLVEQFTPDHIVFGTDFPHVLESTTYGNAAHWLDYLPFLDDRAREAIGNVNPRRIWRFSS